MRFSAAFAVVVLSAGLAACGSTAKSSSDSSPAVAQSQLDTAGGAPTTGPDAGRPAVPNADKNATSASRPATAITPPPATSGPGVGRPAVRIGDESSPEQDVLGALYARALAAKGFKVTLKDNVGSSETTYRALTSGQIDMYPEHIGTLLSTIAKRTQTPSSATATYERAQAFVNGQGLALLNYTPFSNSDALATQPRYAGEHGLSSIADLQTMGKSVTLGAPPEFATRFEGLRGLKREYGLDPTFTPIASDLSFKALESDRVDVQSVSTTAGQLLSGKFELLGDPKHVFGFQNAAPVIKRSVLAAEGPAFARTLNKVSSLLTIGAMLKMNAAVGLDKQSASTVALHFLAANGLA